MKIPQTGKRMHADAIHCEVGQRVASALRQVYPANAAKRIARDFEVDERTAKGWLAGQTPQGKHLLALMHRLGAHFAAAVLVPVGDWASELQARARLDAIQQDLDDLGRDLIALEQRRKAHRGENNNEAAGALARVVRAPAAGQGSTARREGPAALGSDHRPVADPETNARLLRAFDAQKRRIAPWGGR